MHIFVQFPACLLLASVATAGLAQNQAAAPAAREATTIYRHVLPGGQVFYSDEAVAGARIDHTIRVPAPIAGNLWSTAPGTRPVVPAPAIPTPVKRMPGAPVVATARMAGSDNDAMQIEVMRAEMLLEDAKMRQAEGAKPLPFELRDNSDGGPSTNQAYASRQKRLARDVAYAEEQLQRALDTRNRRR